MISVTDSRASRRGTSQTRVSTASPCAGASAISNRARRRARAACVRHEPVGTKRGGPFGALPCNAFVWCPADVPGGACFEPDAHAHGAGDCWRKFTETPEAPQVNQRGANDAAAFTNEAGVSYRERHRDAPEQTHWTSGVVLPRGWVPSGGRTDRARAGEKSGEPYLDSLRSVL